MQKRPYEDQPQKSTVSAQTASSRQRPQALTALSEGLGAKIAALEVQAKAVLALTDKVRATLPEPDKSHVISASYDDSTLVITVDSGAWCARIRYAEDALRNQLAALSEKPFTELKVRVGRP